MTNDELDSFLKEWTPLELKFREHYLKSLKDSRFKQPFPPPPYPKGQIPPNVSLNEESPIKIFRHERYGDNFYHSHLTFEIMYIYSGKCKHNIDGEEMLLDEGDLFFIPPGTFHLPSIHDESILINILVEPSELNTIIKQLDEVHGKLIDYLGSVVRSRNYSDYLYIPATPDYELRGMFCSLINEYFENRQYRNFQMRTIFKQIICHLERAHSDNIQISERNQHSDIPTKYMLQYTSENIQTVTLEKLSRLFHYSKQHICRIILQATGKTFGEYLTELRLDRAKTLLQTSNLSVVSIASMCGYTSDAYFHRLFRKYVGMTPIEYRKTNQK